MIIVDTNVVSEMMRPAGSPAVLEWARAQSAAELHLTAVTVAEVRYGVARLPEGRRKETLHTSAEEIFAAFADKMLPFDTAAAEQYAAIVAARDRAGRPIEPFDALIASICKATGGSLATRNGKDFEHTGVGVVDPWD